MTARPELASAIAQMLEALRLEKAELRARLGSLGGAGRVRVDDGRQLASEPGAHVYRFACALDLTVPEGTAVRLEAEGEATGGEVLRHDRDEETIALVCRQDLGAAIPHGTITFDTAYLLDRIAARLRAIGDEAGSARGDGEPAAGPPFSPDLALDLLTGAPAAGPAIPVPAEGASAAQRRAVGFALGQRVAYLWGPPGTGKTRTLALLVRALADRGEQTLVAAHTNVATDTALRRVLDLGPLPPGAALRVGPAGEALAGCGVGLDEAVDRALRAEAPPLAAAIDAACRAAAGRIPRRAALLANAAVPLPRRLRAAAALLGDAPPDVGAADALADDVAGLTVRLQALEGTVAARAAILATTLTRAATGALFRGLRPGTVVIDEASMAPLLLAFSVAALAQRRAIAVGDFLQLAPIVQAAGPLPRRWLGTHVFAQAGCDRVEADHPLRVLLDEQWRMHPQIAAVVSRTFYGGRLRDAAARLADAPPDAILLVDTARTAARSAPSGEGSKLNLVHAELAAALALEAAPHDEVAIIAPYRAQVRRIRRLLRASAPLAAGRIEVASVHRFQGREKGVVVFDTVEAPGTAPRFLDELHNPEAPRLVNVALSRAVRRLVILFHSAQARALGPAATLPRVLAAARAAGARELLADAPEDRAALAAALRGEAAAWP